MAGERPETSVTQMTMFVALAALLGTWIGAYFSSSDATHASLASQAGNLQTFKAALDIQTSQIAELRARVENLDQHGTRFSALMQQNIDIILKNQDTLFKRIDELSKQEAELEINQQAKRGR